MYGWRPETWIELTHPVWAENPTPVFRLIRDYLQHPEDDPRRANRRAAGRRRRLVRRTRRRLAADPERLAQFDALYAQARPYVPVRETRALWQLTTTGVLRPPCLALGRKLCAAGLLGAPDDAFYLRLDELQRLARTGQVGVEIALDHRSLIDARRADRAHWLGIVPPFIIGTPDPAVRDDVVKDVGRFTGLGLEDGEPRVLRGGGASRGIVQARARVVLSMADADKLAPGEVLVCRMTSPAWTPLLARAGAVVADSGGILAHCAIVARELAIPCVVGVGIATDRIADGMLVTVDGAQGLVRLDG